MSKLIRAALAAVAALAAAGVIASTAAVGVASAADTASTGSPETRDPRLPVLDGRTIAEVKATGTKGPAGDSLNTKASCEKDAAFINETIASGMKDLYADKMAGAAAKFGEAVRLLEQSEREGVCIIE